MDVERIVKSDNFLKEEFKDFVPSSGQFIGSSFIWSTLNSYDNDFENIGKKLKVLLDFQFDPFLRAGSSDFISPFNFASQRDMESCVKHLLEYEDANSLDNLGFTPLLNACQNGNKKIINMLLKAGADPMYGLEFKPRVLDNDNEIENDNDDGNEIENGNDNNNDNEIDELLNDLLIFAKPLPCDYPFIKSIDAQDQLSLFEGLSDETKLK